jgi:hypothetical protein
MNTKRKAAALVAATAMALLAPLTPAEGASPPVVNGTTQLGMCDSVDAVSAVSPMAFACWGTEKTDLKALRRAYRQGGMAAVQTVSARQQGITATGVNIALASGGTQLTGYSNNKYNSYTWTYSGTIIYGSIDTNGHLTEYGRVFVSDKIVLNGAYANFTFTFKRALGSDVAVAMKDYWTNVGWSGSTNTCPRTNWLQGHTATCNYSTYLGSFGGSGFYAHSQVQWWNQVSPNPSPGDGSWTVTEPHGPMDCVSTRAQKCLWR